MKKLERNMEEEFPSMGEQEEKVQTAPNLLQKMDRPKKTTKMEQLERQFQEQQKEEAKEKVGKKKKKNKQIVL